MLIRKTMLTRDRTKTDEMGAPCTPLADETAVCVRNNGAEHSASETEFATSRVKHAKTLKPQVNGDRAKNSRRPSVPPMPHRSFPRPVIHASRGISIERMPETRDKTVVHIAVSDSETGYGSGRSVSR